MSLRPVVSNVGLVGDCAAELTYQVYVVVSEWSSGSLAVALQVKVSPIVGEVLSMVTLLIVGA